jgi:FKBP-type peptidyl-prolyl cis-trans isomerase FklB
MKKTTFSLFLFLSVITGFTQTTKTVTAQKTIPSKPPLKKPLLSTLRDSVSYTAGIHIVNRYRTQNIVNFNSAFIAKAINDLQTGKPQLLSDQDADMCVLSYQSALINNKKIENTSTSPNILLKNVRDSASYAAGIYAVNFFRGFDITNFNTAIITKAINDLQANKKPLLNDSLANMVALRYQQKTQMIKNKPTIDAGQKFLAENKKRKGVITTKSGLQYEIIRQGTGILPAKGDKVSCHYTGSYIDGTEFNNSYTMGGPIEFSVTGVIKGWTEALLMMPVGSKWKLYVPYHLGYGPGQYQTIPGGSALVFEIDLLSVVGK